MPFKGANTVAIHEEPSLATETAGDFVDLAGEDATVLCIRTRPERFRFRDQATGRFILMTHPDPDKPWEIPEGMVSGKLSPSTLAVLGTSEDLVGRGDLPEAIDAFGHWEKDPTFGLQFSADLVRYCLPNAAVAMRKFLSSGHLDFIGPATAAAIVRRFGTKTKQVLDETPEQLLEIKGVTETRLEAIKKAWSELKEDYDLLSFFGLCGLTDSVVARIRRHFHDKKSAADILRIAKEEPYSLLAVEGLGFTTVDRLALGSGISKQDPARLLAALDYVLDKRIQDSGDTAIAVSNWVETATASLGVSGEILMPLVKKLLEDKVVIPLPPLDDTGTVYVQPAKFFRMEANIASDLKHIYASAKVDPLVLAKVMSQSENPARQLDPLQKVAVWRSLAGRVAVLTGGPGTGKTTVIRTLIDVAKHSGLSTRPSDANSGWAPVLLAAPTGRAARRMATATGTSAATVHRMLGFRVKEGGIKGFRYNRHEPLPTNLLIVDESSMLDTWLASRLVEAVAQGTRLLFVGDADQLPSVSPGNVLRDIIGFNGFRVSRLSYIHRTAEGSRIALAARNILAGRLPDLSVRDLNGEFVFIPTAPEAVADTVASVVSSLLASGQSTDDLQVLIPQYSGVAGVDKLNLLLRHIMNPAAQSTEEPPLGKRWFPGDKLMQIRNNYSVEFYRGSANRLMGDDDKDSGSLFNGEMCTVVGRGTKTNDIHLLDTMGEEFSVSVGQVGKDMTPGYAVTIHKSQGNEYATVVTVATRSQSFMLDRSLLYTAVTRGKQRVIVVGDERTLSIAVHKISKGVRVTGLKAALAASLEQFMLS